MSLGEFLFEKLNDYDPWLLCQFMNEFYGMEEEE